MEMGGVGEMAKRLFIFSSLFIIIITEEANIALVERTIVPVWKCHPEGFPY